MSQLFKSEPIDSETSGTLFSVSYSELGQDAKSPLYPFLEINEFATFDESMGNSSVMPLHHNVTVITYLLEGQLQCSDYIQDTGRIAAGDVYWSAAGRGLIYLERPNDYFGRLHGFQVRLESTESMNVGAPGFDKRTAGEFPVYSTNTGAFIKAIMGNTTAENRVITGAMSGKSTGTLLLEIALIAGTTLEIAVPSNLTALTYVFEGNLCNSNEKSSIPIAEVHHLGVWTNGDYIECKAGPFGARFLLMAAESRFATQDSV